MNRARSLLLIASALVFSSALLSACSGSSSGSAGGGDGAPREGQYSANIVRTEMGIPHITAKDFGSLGYGQGYAFAEDNLCVMMDDFVTTRGERSRYFGPDGSYTIPANGSVADNVSSDFFWKFIADAEAIKRTEVKTIPRFKTLVKGWTVGFNRYMSELKQGQHPGRHATCATGEWLQPISTDDMYRRFVRLSVLASSSVFINEIANAQPPGLNSLPLLGSNGSGSALPGPLGDLLAPVLDVLGGLGLPVAQIDTPLRATPYVPGSAAEVAWKQQALVAAPGGFADLQEHERFGSNMYAFGKNGSTTGNPIVYGNPHFPWSGTERLWISHNTIPGQFDIMGSSLYGVPAVLIGFNKNVAWSHTVSTAYRFTFYELKLNPLNPTQYIYDGEIRSMTAVPLTIQVKNADGQITERKRTLYKSHFGPMLTISASGVPVLAWSSGLAYGLRDANLENDRLINQFGRWNEATSLDDFIATQATQLGVPWVNTVASGPGGQVYYGDVTVVPNVPDSLVASCRALPFSVVIDQVAAGLPLLDGSRSSCEWLTDSDAPAPGIFGAKNLPTIKRDDYVTNCNDSYWLTNTKQPLTGFARIIGDENSPRSLRTRLCLLQAERRLDGSDGRPGKGFDIATLQEIALSSQIYSAELARQHVVDSLCGQPTLIGSNGPATSGDVSAACTVLAAWDGSDNLASVGSHIWREFWRRTSKPALGLPIGLPVPTPLTDLWSVPFSSNDPVNTPNTLNTRSLAVQMAFADAVAAVKVTGIPFDRPLGEIQRSGVHGDAVLPVFGGSSGAGAFTVISTNPENLTPDGYVVEYGNSYLQTVTWDSQRNPIAAGFITYSQSTDPASPHFKDFTQAYGMKRWQTFPFSPAQIQQQTISRKTLSQ
ncbi:MAG: penicillin acylase family protein [Paraperlucidibaca sp.]